MRSALAFLAIVVAVAAAFAPAWNAGFVNWDDADLLFGNRWFRGFSSEHLAWMFTTNHVGPYQPLTWLSFALDHAAWGFTDAFDAPQARGFHATSLALHAATACATFVLARRFLPSAGAALVAALLFAVHPLRVESVAWVTERRDVLYGLFLVLSVVAWLRWRDAVGSAPVQRAWSLAACVTAAGSAFVLLASTTRPAGPQLRFAFEPLGVCASFALLAACVFAVSRAVPSARPAWLALAVAAFVLSTLAKAAGMALPVALALLELRALGSAGRRVWLDKLPFAAVAFVVALLAYWGQAAHPEAVVSWSDHTLSERLAQSAYGLAFYVGKSLAPSDLVALRGLPGEVHWGEARFALPACAVLASAVALAFARRRASAPLTAFALYAVLVAPMLGLAQCGPQLVADRYSYVPTIPLAILAAGALERVSSARVARVIGAGCALALGIATQRQTRVWHDSETLWRATLALEPASAIANAGLADALKLRAFAEPEPVRRRALLEESLGHFERSFVGSAAPRSMSNAAVLSLELARLDSTRAVELRERAVDLGRAAVALARRRGESANGLRLALAVALFDTARFDEAIDELRACVELDPASFVAWSHLGLALAESGRAAEALPALRRATELAPDERGPWWYLGCSLEALGEREAALTAFEQVLRIAPAHAAARERVERLRAR
ncbi:MAG: tetratricopeptide repeat protein [Planctomycetes bacterium]|nr:tetratricopeptide repeat protein [Planctomycetota bacterium]